MKWFAKQMILVVGLAGALLLPVNAVWAQLAPPNDMGVRMGHIHLNVRDVQANKDLFVALGGTPVQKVGDNEVIKFPGVLILLRKMEPTGGSVGSVVNHFGFQVPNVAQAMDKWKAAGVKTEAGRNAQQGFVITPDEVRIEILEDATLKVPITMHHIHFFVDQAAIPEMQAWYAKTFGAKPGKRGDFQADDLPGVNLTFAPSPTATAPTKGRALDHIGFEITGLEAFCKKLEASGIKLDRPYGKNPAGLGIAFITDPWGTNIELNEGLDKL
jgi:catechol 2,3-dioxygenase-like lactoylglutathione lyase family enzyme